MAGIEEPEQFEKIVAPLRSAFGRLTPGDRRSLLDMRPIMACVKLLTNSANASGLNTLSRALKVHQAREALVVVAGGVLGADDVANRLGITTDGVFKLVKSGELLAVDDDGRLLYPSNQIDGHGQILDGLTEVIARLSGLGIEGWMALDVLNSPSPKFGLSPMNLLSLGRKESAMETVASLENQGAA